jgi:hypothetical protein
MAVITLVNRAHRAGTQFAYELARSRSLSPSRAFRVPDIRRDIDVKIASTPAEWTQALELVADQYQARGYDAQGYDYLFTSYHALPDSVTLVAKERSRVVAALSLVMDNSLLGLPMEAIYGPEVKELRRTGRRLCEVGNLADTDLSSREFIAVFVALIRLAWQHHVHYRGDTGVITVNPRHSAFYTKVLGFVPLGARRVCPSVRNHPAKAFLVDPGILRWQAPAMHARIFGEPLPRPVLLAPRMPAALIRHFAHRSSQTDPRLAEEILTYVEAYGSPRRW